MSALTNPRRVATHSRWIRMSDCITSATSTVGGGGEGATLWQAAKTKSGTSATILVSMCGRIAARVPQGSQVLMGRNRGFCRIARQRSPTFTDCAAASRRVTPATRSLDRAEAAAGLDRRVHGQPAPWVPPEPVRGRRVRGRQRGASGRGRQIQRRTAFPVRRARVGRRRTRLRRQPELVQMAHRSWRRVLARSVHFREGLRIRFGAQGHGGAFGRGHLVLSDDWVHPVNGRYAAWSATSTVGGACRLDDSRARGGARPHDPVEETSRAAGTRAAVGTVCYTPKWLDP